MTTCDAPLAISIGDAANVISAAPAVKAWHTRQHTDVHPYTYIRAPQAAAHDVAVSMAPTGTR